MRRRVVITGMGAVTPLGVGADALIERWADGECGIEDGEGRCDAFDPGEFMTRKEARRSDRFAQFAIAASEEALGQAGWSDGLPYEQTRIGCVIGTGIGGLGSLEEQENVLRERGAKAVSPLSVPLMMGNAAAAALAMRHGIHGQTYGVVSACAAGARDRDGGADDRVRRRRRRGRRRRGGGPHGARRRRVRGDGSHLAQRDLATVRQAP